MDNLRLRMLLVVFGAVTLSVPLSAEPVDASPETSAELSASTDADASQTPPSGSPAATKSEGSAGSAVVPSSDAAPETAPATEESEAAYDTVPETESDAAAKPAVSKESDASVESFPAPSSEVEASESPNSLSLSFLLSSIYNFRGMNVFMENSQSDQNALFSPSITGTVFHPGLWIGYAGFFQINGDNRAYLVNSGVGAEQDIAVGFDYDLTRKLTLSTSLTYMFYPFALSRIIGVDCPSYLEPALGIQFRTNRGIRLGLQLSYFAPIQERLRDDRYMYTRLSVGKFFQFHPRLALDLSYTAGYKLFADPTIWQDTIFDMEFCLSLPFSITDKLKAVSGAHAAWGYLSGTSFGDQYMIYFSLDLVADF